MLNRDDKKLFMLGVLICLFLMWTCRVIIAEWITFKNPPNKCVIESP